MSSMSARIATLIAASLATAAAAQPALVITSIGDDLSHDGTAVAGLLYDAELELYAPYTWSRAGGFVRLPMAGTIASSAKASGDLSAITLESSNTTNWGDLNCFAGYDSDGNPNPPADPCQVGTISHRWTSPTGWVNLGSFDRYPDPVTGRFIGGTHCGNVNTPNDISGDGNVTVGGGWVATAINQWGGISSGLCNEFYAYAHNAQTNVFTRLAVQPGTTTSRADRVNHDGSVIVGYDLGPIPDGSGGFYDGRRMCVWVNGVQTLIDPYGNSDSAPVNPAGTIIAGVASAGFAQANFGVLEDFHIARWTRQGDGTWTAQDLGRLADRALPLSMVVVLGMSDDGGTVVGWARYGSFWEYENRAFISRADINGGAPMDLQEYLASIDDPNNPIAATGMIYPSATNISGDGNAIQVTFGDQRNFCLEPAQSLLTLQGAIVYLNGNVPCTAPAIAMQPADWVETYPGPFGSTFNAFVSGSWPLTYQWQREDPNNPGQWNTISDSCGNFDPFFPWEYEGTIKSQLRVNQANGGGDRAGNYRFIVSNPCGSVTSEPATLTHISGACCLPDGTCSIDYATSCGWSGGTYLGDGSICDGGCAPACDPDVNCDGSPDQGDVACMILAVAGDIACICQDPDFNRDGSADQGDVAAIIGVVAGQPCP